MDVRKDINGKDSSKRKAGFVGLYTALGLSFVTGATFLITEIGGSGIDIAPMLKLIGVVFGYSGLLLGIGVLEKPKNV